MQKKEEKKEKAKTKTVAGKNGKGVPRRTRATFLQALTRETWKIRVVLKEGAPTPPPLRESVLSMSGKGNKINT